MNDITEISRAVVRPIITIIFAVVLAQVIVKQIPISPLAWTLLSGVILWWFGDRTVHRIKDKKDV